MNIVTDEELTPLCIEGSLTQGLYSLFCCLVLMTASNSDTINRTSGSQYLTAVDFSVLLVQEYYVFILKQKFLFQLHMKKHTIHSLSARTGKGIYVT